MFAFCYKLYETFYFFYLTNLWILAVIHVFLDNCCNKQPFLQAHHDATVASKNLKPLEKRVL